MEEFNGASKATVRSKTPTGMWEHARNIVLTKGRSSITQNDGFDFTLKIPGETIGEITTTEHVVVFSVDGEYSCIGYKNENDEYIGIIRSIYLGFNLARPIEGEGFYNQKQELIVIFSDGIFEDSFSPRLLNIFDTGIDLDVDLELVNPDDITILNLFIGEQEANINIDYEEISTLEADIVYITYSYILPDNVSSSPFYVTQNIAYPTYKTFVNGNFTLNDLPEDNKRRNIKLFFENLSLNYNAIKIGIIVNSENALVAYESQKLIYNGTTLETTISTLSNFTEIDINSLVVESINYNKVKTFTIQNNQLAIGNLIGENEFKFQKYANLLKIEPMFIDEDLQNNYEETIFTHPTLCFDEVYAISIQPQLKNGNYLDSYHIPGRQAINDERDLFTDAELIAMGLDDLIGNSYRKFHVINTGKFTIGAPYSNNESDLSTGLNRQMECGFWENEETYPNNIEYNSIEDYNGNVIVDGIDFRNSPILYHRMPGLDAIIEKIPSLLGYYNKNSHDLSYGNLGTGDPTDPEYNGKVPRLGIRLTNFEEIVPLEVRNQLQGFRINIQKRKQGGYLVEDIGFSLQVSESIQNVDGILRSMLTNVLYQEDLNVNNAYRTRAEHFGKAQLFSNTLEIYKSNISPTIVKANYGVSADAFAAAESSTNRNNKIEMQLPLIYKIPPVQKYAIVKAMTYLPENNITEGTLFNDAKIVLLSKNYLQGNNGLTGIRENRWNPFNIQYGSTDTANLERYNSISRLYDEVTVTGDDCYEIILNYSLINIVKNVYPGFSSTDFISLGRVLITNTTKELYKNGDVFINNSLTKSLGISVGSTIIGRLRYFYIHLTGMVSVANNSKVTVVIDKSHLVYDLTGSGGQTTLLGTLSYETIIDNEEQFRSLNDKIVSISFSIDSPFINKYPFRIALSQSIPNENLQTNNVRSFPANKYYDMPNNKGELTALRGTIYMLYIQQRYTLSVASIKDTLENDGTVIQLGTGNLFDKAPVEIHDNNKGYIGSTSQFACKLIPDYYITVDQNKGKIFLVNGTNAIEVSKANMEIYFSENWNTFLEYFRLDERGNKQPVDNPFNSVGHIVGYDEKYNRVFFTKKYYKIKDDTLYDTFDGMFFYNSEGDIMNYDDTLLFDNLSITWSLNLEKSPVWVCKHDYYPKVYIWNSKGLYSISPTIDELGNVLFRHNSKLQSKGVFYGNIQYNSYVDLIFNSRIDLTKLYQCITWNTDVIDVNEVQNYYDKTIDAIAVYTNYQCSGIIDLTNQQFVLNRNVEGNWNFNKFKDIVINKDVTIIDKEGNFNIDNLNNLGSWFYKSNFISTFIVVRLIIFGGTTNNVYINQVNVKSVTSQR